MRCNGLCGGMGGQPASVRLRRSGHDCRWANGRVPTRGKRPQPSETGLCVAGSQVPATAAAGTGLEPSLSRLWAGDPSSREAERQAVGQGGAGRIAGRGCRGEAPGRGRDVVLGRAGAADQRAACRASEAVSAHGNGQKRSDGPWFARSGWRAFGMTKSSIDSLLLPVAGAIGVRVALVRGRWRHRIPVPI